MLAPSEERSGVVPCGTPCGQWYQIVEEVFTEGQLPPGTRAQDIQRGLQSQHVAVAWVVARSLRAGFSILQQ